jgi:nicotinamide-nucleotide amidase
MIDDELLAAARRVVEGNRAAGLLVSVAESCTGGLLAAAITEIPGASEMFDRGFVTYSNEAKIEALGVSSEIIETFGAVSLACAWAMARGCLNRSQADVAVAVTGIAGPSGETDKKPVGHVLFACARRGGDPNKAVTHSLDLGNLGRPEIRRQATLFALSLLMPPEAGEAP